MFFFRIDQPARAYIISFFLWWDYGKNSKTLFKKIRKISSTKSVYFFYFTVVVWTNLVQIGSLITEIQMCGKKYDQFYMMPIYSKIIANIKISSEIVLLFDYKSVYQILYNFIYWVKSCKCLIHSPPPPFGPSLWH